MVSTLLDFTSIVLPWNIAMLYVLVTSNSMGFFLLALINKVEFPVNDREQVLLVCLNSFSKSDFVTHGKSATTQSMGSGMRIQWERTAWESRCLGFKNYSYLWLKLCLICTYSDGPTRKMRRCWSRHSPVHHDVTEVKEPRFFRSLSSQCTLYRCQYFCVSQRCQELASEESGPQTERCWGRGVEEGRGAWKA